MTESGISNDLNFLASLKHAKEIVCKEFPLNETVWILLLSSEPSPSIVQFGAISMCCRDTGYTISLTFSFVYSPFLYEKYFSWLPLTMILSRLTELWIVERSTVLRVGGISSTLIFPGIKRILVLFPSSSIPFSSLQTALHPAWMSTSIDEVKKLPTSMSELGSLTCTALLLIE